MIHRCQSYLCDSKTQLQKKLIYLFPSSQTCNITNIYVYVYMSTFIHISVDLLQILEIHLYCARLG